MSRRRCLRCHGERWVWLRATAPSGAVRIAEASCPSCRGRGVVA